MKRESIVKRITAFLLTLMMVAGGFLAVNTTVEAAESGILHVHKLSNLEVDSVAPEDLENYYLNTKTGKYHQYLEGATYAIYKIGTFTQGTDSDGNVLINYTPIPGLKYMDGEDVVLDKDTKQDLINVSGMTPVCDPQTTKANGPITFNEGLELDGVYLVKETKTPAGVTKANNFIISVPMHDQTEGWITEISAFPKNSSSGISVEKTAILPNGGDGNKSVNVGQVFSYKIEVSVPDDIEEANYEKFDVIDTSHKALSIDMDTIKVEVDGTELTASQYAVSGPVENADGKNVRTISFYDAAGKALYDLKDKNTIVITYDAFIDGKLLDGTAISNRASVAYKTDGGEGEEPEEPEEPGTEEVFTYTYALQKIDDEKNLLSGAEFRITAYILDTPTGDDPYEIVQKGTPGSTLHYLTWDTATEKWGYTTDESEEKIYTMTSDEDDEALVIFSGLKYGYYYIEEVEAPEGYTLLLDPIEVIINATTTADHYAGVGYSKQVINTEAVGGGLPGTGGYGIYLYLILGVVLIVAGAYTFTKIKRERSEA